LSLTDRTAPREIALAVATVLFLVIAGLMISMSKAPAPGRAATAAACEQAVHMLLTTESMVELERAKYLIRSMRCDVRNHVPVDVGSPR
jgi:hypothetical protein